MQDHKAAHVVSNKLHAANIANARRNNPAKILPVADELSCKFSLYRIFLVDTFKTIVYLFGKNVKIAFWLTILPWPWPLWRHNISKWRKTDHGSEGATYFFKILKHPVNNIRSQIALRSIWIREVIQLLQE